jgi:hypothetical protein
MDNELNNNQQPPNPFASASLLLHGDGTQSVTTQAQLPIDSSQAATDILLHRTYAYYGILIQIVGGLREGKTFDSAVDAPTHWKYCLQSFYDVKDYLESTKLLPSDSAHVLLRDAAEKYRILLFDYAQRSIEEPSQVSELTATQQWLELVQFASVATRWIEAHDCACPLVS